MTLYPGKKKILLLFVVALLTFLYSLARTEKTKNRTFLFMTVKTSFKNHNTRVQQILATWYQLAPENIYFITDAFDPILFDNASTHLISTECGYGHENFPLRCKFNEELHVMLKHNATWSCHFDDDNYVNVPLLENVLSEFNPELPYYLGRTSDIKPNFINGKMYWAGAGGAGICISNAALNIISTSILNNSMVNDHAINSTGDDTGFGYLMATHNIGLTEMNNFLYQYDNLNRLPLKAINDTPVFGYREQSSFVKLPHFFPPTEDPFKFKTLHCFIFPDHCSNFTNKINISIYSNSKLKTYGTYSLSFR